MDAPNTETTFAVAPTFSPGAILQDSNKGDELLATIEAELAKQNPDTSSEKGRKAIASFAYRIARTKTAIDDAGAEKVKDINATRKRMAAKLDELRDRARQPLTEWEEADKKRLAECNEVIEFLRTSARVSLTAKSVDVTAKLVEVQSVTIDPDRFRELTQLATDLRTSAIDELKTAIETLQTREREAEELARLKSAEAPKPQPTIARTIEAETRPAAVAPVEKPTEDKTEGKGGVMPNRRAVFAEAIEAVEKAGGVDRGTATKIVLAIAAKQIPHVTISF